MRTPSDDNFQRSSPNYERSTHTTCPPDINRLEEWRTREDSHLTAEDDSSSDPSSQRPAHSPRDTQMSDLMEDTKYLDSQSKMDEGEVELSNTDASSPMTIQAEPKDSRECLSPSPVPSVRAIASPSSPSYEFSSVRVRTAVLVGILESVD